MNIKNLDHYVTLCMDSGSGETKINILVYKNKCLSLMGLVHFPAAFENVSI